MQNNLNLKSLAEKTFDSLSSILEEILEDKGEIDESEGIIKISLSNHDTFLLNFHSPSNQIWLSSPLSGALHFSWEAQQGKWLATRAPHEDLLAWLEKDLSQLCGFSVNLR